MRRIGNATFGIVALLVAGYLSLSGPPVHDISEPLAFRPTQLFVGALFIAGGFALLGDSWKPGKIEIVITAYFVILAGAFIGWIIYFAPDT